MPRLTCTACGRPLTRDCRWGALAEHDLTGGDRAPTVPVGALVRLTEESSSPITQADGRVIGLKVFSPAGAIVAHPDDVLADALLSHGLDNGCCGSGGYDGPNRACLCGAVVATEWSDCWTQAEVRFLPDAVGENSPNTQPFSPLERAVFQAIAGQFPQARAALLEQLSEARVTNRDFTGVGFFTEFEVPRRIPPAAGLANPIGHVRSSVGPDRFPLEFMLWVTDGYAHTIEACSFEDGYGDLDLLTADFTPPVAAEFQKP
jgi:hypothetical protein